MMHRRDAVLAEIASRTGTDRILPFAPTPIQTRALQRSDVDTTTLIHVWNTAQARLCERCPLERCTRAPIPGLEAYSTCVQVVRGRVLGPGFAALVAADP